MRTNTLPALLLLSLIMFDVSDASFVLKLRNLVGPDPKDDKPKDPNPVGETNEVNKGSPSPVPQPQPQQQPLPKVKNNSVPPVSVPPPPKTDDEGDKGQKEEKGPKISISSTTETCEGLNTCTDEGDMVACISQNATLFLIYFYMFCFHCYPESVLSNCHDGFSTRHHSCLWHDGFLWHRNGGRCAHGAADLENG